MNLTSFLSRSFASKGPKWPQTGVFGDLCFIIRLTSNNQSSQREDQPVARRYYTKRYNSEAESGRNNNSRPRTMALMSDQRVSSGMSYSQAVGPIQVNSVEMATMILKGSKPLKNLINSKNQGRYTERTNSKDPRSNSAGCR